MGDGTTIEWSDATWNPVRGCSRVSPGCGGANHEGGCYAEKIAARFSGPGQPFEGFARRTPNGGQWTGKLALVETALDLPLRWKRPRKIFVNSMSDLFHENLPDEAIDRVFAVMALAPQHIFQVLTKRARRIRDYLQVRHSHNEVELAAEREHPSVGTPFSPKHVFKWPLPNVWVGVSVEDQARADERIPLLLDTPAAVRFISAEPLLGPIRIDYLDRGPRSRLYPLRGEEAMRMRYPDNGIGDFSAPTRIGGKIDWVITGGESGSNARPMHPTWARSLRDQCQAAGVAFFFKQHGEFAPSSVEEWAADDGSHRHMLIAPDGRYGNSVADLITQPRGTAWLRRVGKKAAGRLLDGKEHSEFPV